jgi:hypothetical protein
MEIPPFQRDLPLGVALPVPLWEVTLNRSMRTYGASLGLSPHIAGVPSLDVMAAIITGRRSFVALLRRALGETDFRNLRNYALGRVRSSRVVEGLKAKYGADDEAIEAAAAIIRDPATSVLAQIASVAEGVAYRVVSWVHACKVPCACCGGNLVPTSDYWWSRQPCDLGRPEAELVDRVCMVTIGAQFFLNLQADGQHSPTLRDLVSPGGHPFKNWLNAVMRLTRGESLSSMPARTGARVSAESVLRYGRGEMLTPEAVEELTSKIPDAAALKASARAARALAFAIEFLAAAQRGAPLSEEMARKIVSARVHQILADTDLIVRHLFGELKLKVLEASERHGVEAQVAKYPIVVQA